MSNLSKGKYAQAISDRSGQAFPYSEMVTEWNGAFVHVSEFEPKHPQLEPRRFTADGQGLPKARPARVEPATPNLLQANPFVFRNVDGSPGGIAYSVFENASGFSITVTDTNNYTFLLGATPIRTEKGGGVTVTAGPVNLTP